MTHALKGAPGDRVRPRASASQGLEVLDQMEERIVLRNAGISSDSQPVECDLECRCNLTTTCLSGEPLERSSGEYH